MTELLPEIRSSSPVDVDVDLQNRCCEDAEGLIALRKYVKTLTHGTASTASSPSPAGYEMRGHSLSFPSSPSSFIEVATSAANLTSSAAHPEQRRYGHLEATLHPEA